MAEDLWIIREATRHDASFMADMLVEAVNWSPQWKRRSRNQVLADPKTARYIDSWPRDGDVGVIADVTGQPVGADSDTMVKVLISEEQP